MKKIKIKSVAFNVADPDQLADLEHAKKRTNFSAYVKRLIYKDRVSGGVVKKYISMEEESPTYEGLI
ncbi:hypothetical protein [Salipaludibacillus sp. CF4.18]|uniref:hypothetical protein n=1 Tax=Salipaludibacillus sp. CF4.18 TaxID=3373081 RepID=UPI003EE6DAB7